jgi:hypothetical protein
LRSGSFEIFIAAATFIPLDVPQKIPSFLARSLHVFRAKVSSIDITLSTMFAS